MAKTTDIVKLKEELGKIRLEKMNQMPIKRRYSAKEIEIALQAAVELSSSEVSRLSGIRVSTISVWKRRSEYVSNSKDKSDANNSSKADKYNGYHKHWQRVIDLWKAKPGLGPAQLSNQLKREGIKISVSTVRNILEENGYTPPLAKHKTERVFRYEAARARELVHMDFKHFYINKQKVFLLLMQDDYSRFLCGHQLTESENIDTVIEVFESCVSKYGRMQMLMTDAGSAFYSWNGINRFQKLIAEEYGVDHIKAGSPRSNGKIESVNKQIEKELLQVKLFSSLEEASCYLTI
jgi:transposase InsO family protein